MTEMRTKPQAKEENVFSATASNELYRKTILLIVVFFVIHFGMLTLRVAAVELDHQAEIAKARAILTPMGAFLCYGMFLLLRPWRNRAFSAQAILGAFLSGLCALLHGWIWSHFLFALDPYTYPNTFGKHIYHSLYWYLFYFSWTTAYLALAYSIAVREQERRSSALLAEAQDAKIRALRYQINPHFLFNTLNSIAQLIGEDKQQAERMILNLSEFFRTSLAVDPAEDVRLADEIALQELYLRIERVRFPERLELQVRLPSDLADAKVPSLILQPLVENAIRHGVARSEAPTRVEILAEQQNGMLLLLRVADDAAESPAVPLARNGTGVGLNNVRNRLAARYGDQSSLRAMPGEERGFSAEIMLPLQF